MAGKGKKGERDASRVVARNRRARFDYFIEDTFEAGIMLQGTEVKSLRGGKASINEAYARPKDGELYLLNAYIPEFEQAGEHLQHETHRPRKLLMHRRQIDRVINAVNRDGMTLVPLSIYFNDRGRAKLELALGRGKKLHDKRQTSKERDWKRDQSRLLRNRG
ncbi:MAG TPA: SsrA-binding protein SmpB [Alphaproteobacteria bacterium]|nr:SsrA-binding protein SmpB [Alphaproteobacteria bacterium]